MLRELGLSILIFQTVVAGVSMSFSSFSSSRSAQNEWYSGDDEVDRDDMNVDNAEEKRELFQLPKGARTQRVKHDLFETTIVAQRYGLSERATVYVFIPLLQAAKRAGILSVDQNNKIMSALVVDKNKIRRNKVKAGNDLK